jgi:DNA-binding MarR family transcriptional regulator
MKKSEILTTLITRFFSFDDEMGKNEEYSIDEFIGYLNAKSGSQELTMREISGENKGWFKDEYRNTTSDISILIVLMNHYAKWYIKKVLRESHLQTPDEFSFLITLMTYDSLSKSELITKQVMEKTSGSEVIRRLIKRGLIVESSDENDKRSVRVSITQSGREEILRILPLMSKVTKIVVGNLSPEEINTLSYLLKKLDYFHNGIYLNKRDQSLSEIFSGITKRKDLFKKE